MLNRFLAWFGTNEGRIVSALAILTEVGAAIYNMCLHQPIDLGSLGGGLAAILTASAALLAAPMAVGAVLAHQRLKLQQSEPKQ